MSGRVETIGDCTLYLGDCLEILPTLGPVDHVISDPPYDQAMQDRLGGERRNDGQKGRARLTFAGIDSIRDAVATQVMAICQGWELLFCNVEGVAPWRDAIEASAAKYKSPMVWVKRDAMPKLNGQGPAPAFEAIVTAWCGKGHSRWNGGGKRGLFDHLTNNSGRHGAHPTEKPVALMAELVTLFSDPGALICDPFMGSGTTGVACARHGRRFVGIEMDERWFDIACGRIEAAYRQPSLLMPAAVPLQQDTLLGDGADT